MRARPSREDFAVDDPTVLEIKRIQRELRQMRAQRIRKNLEGLKQAGIPFTADGLPGHAVIKRPDGTVYDFWANTEKWRRRYDSGSVMLPLANGRGLAELVQAIYRRDGQCHADLSSSPA